ncbi:substrate-binding domain-containing protein [Desulfovibrio sp. JC022]|uniref:substrate-binding domain-containing protein n=1 Tax=Desulfovibrio sp. JC022 TaxID=2593642 RepID=UPI0013D039C3|nr:substrate-binding domain-containing protein [Desulfovibrio sp. JC022]NDV22040.1 ABC transporter substrate-binding protein [Desulfovibrio sp. JC022]
MKIFYLIENKNKFYVLTVFFLALLLLPGCQEQGVEQEKELLVYCGITMIKPMTEIAGIIEEKYDCKVLITKGGSGNLLKSIKANMMGDLYLPGSGSYIQAALEQGLVTDTVHVGFNKAAMMVKKGNPRNIPDTLDSMADSNFYVVIGNPESGSIGRETKKILAKKGIFTEVAENVQMMTTDSKDLVRVIKDDEADLVINWYATSIWPENRESISVLPISGEYAGKKKLIIGLLRFSRYPDISKVFMEYASSTEGRAIFNKYGLYDVK